MVRLPIGALIRNRVAATGLSYRDLSEVCGGVVKHQTFQELANGAPRGWPKSVDTISGMAIALGTSQVAIVLGYAVALGVDVQGVQEDSAAEEVVLSPMSPVHEGVSLGDLIETRKKELGLTYRELEALGGMELSAERWQQLASGVQVLEFPAPRTMLVLAKALEVDVALVIWATARSIGMPMATSGMILTPEQREAIAGMVQAFGQAGSGVAQ